MELANVKGIGIKNLSYFNKLNIYTTEDLLKFYPFRYDIIARSDISKLEDGDKVVIDGIIETQPSIFYFSRKMNKMTFKFNAHNKLFNVVIFNRDFLKSKLTVSTIVTVIGKYDYKKNNIIATNIIFGFIDKTRIIPVYHTTNGLTETKIKSLLSSIKDMPINEVDYVPEYLNQKYNFITKNQAICEVHFPTTIEALKKARNKLKYEELLVFMLKMTYLKGCKELKIGLNRTVDYEEVINFINNLSFKLTADQMDAVRDIYNDLVMPRRMNRLLQGDVGSGKTIVAIIAIYINYLSGYQSALMAPTEILALQHYKTIKELFKSLNINVEILMGSLKAKEKNEINKRLKSGEIDVVIGTHALFTDSIEYNNLGLVITDEQHRFGVNQRGDLKNKGLTPDVLYMSATPIPRTYALTLYGDMDVSNIKTLPSGRKKINTYIKKESEIKDVLYAINDQLKEGHQIYVIAPLIEESDKIDLTNVYDLKDKFERAFGKFYKIGVLHGKLKQEEKDNIMKDFKENKIQLLISTTVIEVGVDVGNATMMVIFDSFRFGLSALHQLRGRVGRSSLESSCYLISNKEIERLKIMTETNDGFKISEEDFRLRGSGDLFGQKQSGDMIFNISDLKKDFNILLQAKEDANELISTNKIDEYEALKDLTCRMDLD